MKPILISKTINAPVELVFKTVAHIEDFSKVVNDIVKIEFLSENKTGVGSRFRETRIMKGKEAATELEVKEYVENEKVRIVAESGGTVWDTLFTVKEENDATKLNVEMNATANNFFSKIMNSLIKGMITKAIEKDMDAVKTYCEK